MIEIKENAAKRVLETVAKQSWKSSLEAFTRRVIL